ncbi:hypothetical protein JBE38_14100 [Pseudomonas sp. ICBG1301]|uniref:dermonecrotic toxin domain-containing protein n=1 Tax=Pseudomonas sp. ICBG1301 TaxID=2795987 RepID=UPI00196236EB|nr:DUF6543 domain-containing protein [Pseudomonas sp. ICBG1301]MBM9487060.1 hypothetical protein [Pseudomonas sp. ICBG1301]
MPDLSAPALADLPLPTFTPSHTTLALNQDENLLLRAEQRLRDCRRDMLELMSHAPTLRATIHDTLQQHLGLDGAQVGLQTPSEGEHAAGRCSLTDACAFLLKYPATDTATLSDVQVLHLPANHPLAKLTTPQLLEQVRRLDIRAALTQAWNRYWAGRAPQTPISRRQRAAQLYREHFEATGLWLKAQDIERATPLTPLFVLLESSDDTPSVNEQKIFTEQLMLKHSDASLRALPGAWVVTLDGEQPVSQLLYVPFHQPAWQVFSQRAAMERWLLEHQRELFDTEAPLATLHYRLQTQPLANGIEQWLAWLVDAQWQSLGSAPQHPVFRDGAPLALLHSDELDLLRRTRPLFSAAAPRQTPSAEEIELDSPPPFGWLGADLDPSHRRAMIRQQRLALETLQGDEPRMNAFKQALAELTAQQLAADAAAVAMLERRPLDTTTLNIQYTALYTARREGLRAEARLQRSLEQINPHELTRLETVLDQPLRAARNEDACVAALWLSITRQNNATTTVTTTELKGPLVITCALALTDPPDTPHSLLLYWPGTGGGLQRFDSCQALATSVLRLMPEEQALSMQLKELNVDPLDYSLNLQHVAFEEQAAQIRSDHPAPPHGRRRAAELEKLRLQTLHSLRVPVHEARDLACLQVLEQDNSAHLAEQLPDWLRSLTAQQRASLKPLMQAYLPAIEQAQQLFDQSLPARGDFVRRHIDARLRKDFALEHGFSIAVELPDAVQQQRDIIPGGNIGGTPTRLVDVPSRERSSLTLEQLALSNIDSTLSLRLGFMRAIVASDAAEEGRALQAGLSADYLSKMVRDLNLAKKYEDHIYATFRGHPDESTFEQQYRREVLIKPWRLLLQLQGRYAVLQNQLTETDLQLLDIAIDADTATAWDSGSRRIRLLPAHLATGGRDTRDEQPITLSGITFIHNAASGLTLLYLPDAPDERFFRRYDSLDQARKGLFDLCRLDKMVQYVAGRAIKGDVRAHIQRIDQAQQKHFTGMIGAGERWPVTTSLSAHLLDAHMGRLIEANRNDARSNEDLALERYALQSGHLFNGIKIALGFVPFVGTAVSLVDGVTQLAGAVDAFRQGETHAGIEQLASVFECLLFAAMDIVPMAAVPSVRADAARRLMRLRQSAHAGVSSGAWRSLASHSRASILTRFDGYAYEKPLSLAGLQPGKQGIYRQVYRHPAGDFILNHGQIFQVEFDKAYQTLRLSGTRKKSYKQPIGLDENGQWDTHGALYGTLVDGGLPGGGNVLGAVADRLDPLWPAMIRQWLPRWWTDHALRQQRRLISRIGTALQSINASGAEVNRLLPRYHADDLSVIPELERAMDNLTAQAQKMDEELVSISRYLRGNRSQMLRKARGDVADDVCLCTQLQVRVSLQQVLKYSDEAAALNTRLQAMPFDQVTGRQTLREQIRNLDIQAFDCYQRTDAAVELMNRWLPLGPGINRKTLVTTAEVINRRYSELERARFKTEALTELIAHRRPGHDIAWHYLQGPLNNAENALIQALYLQRHLLEASPNPSQRNRILQHCISTYDTYQRQLNSWTAGVPQLFDDTYVAQMHQQLSALRARAEKALTTVTPKTTGAPGKRVFETDDNLLLIGDADKTSAPQKPRYTLTGKRGEEHVWEQGSDGKFRRVDAASPTAWQPTPRDLNALTQDAKNRLQNLAAHQARVDGYRRQKMLPADLEFMMTSEADTLELQARHLAELAGDAALVRQLRQKATDLREQGRRLRINQSIASQTPTEGYLDYLLSQQLDDKPIVDIRKTGALEDLGRRQDGRPDFMQEFEIRDIRQATPKPLWYAHFHYESATPKQLDVFVKGHLKLPAQRRLGLKWQQTQARDGATGDVAIWRGDINKPLARQHFQTAWDGLL